jgi:hypothetical protein
MAKRKPRVRVFMHDLWWMPKDKPMKVVVQYPKAIRYGKKHKKARRLYADGVAAGVVVALQGLEVPARAFVTQEPDGKQVND